MFLGVGRVARLPTWLGARLCAASAVFTPEGFGSGLLHLGSGLRSHLLDVGWGLSPVASGAWEAWGPNLVGLPSA